MTQSDPQPTSCQATTQYSLVSRVGAEFVASALTFFTIYMLATVISAMYGINILLIGVATAIAYTAALTIVARISGGHLNPAITLASMLMGRTKYLAGIAYIVAQVLGSLLAASLVSVILPKSQMLPSSTWYTPAVNGFEGASIAANQLKSVNTSFSVVSALIVEVIAGIIIVSTALAMSKEDGKPRCHYAISMGLAYAVGVFVTYPITGSGLNPARSTGIALIAMTQKLTVNPLQQLWVFWIAPIFASAIVGFFLLLTRLAKLPSAANKPVSEETVPVMEQTDHNNVQDLNQQTAQEPMFVVEHSNQDSSQHSNGTVRYE